MNPEYSEHCYLRFGKLPGGGASHDGRTGAREKGVSCFRAERGENGCYILDIPCDPSGRDLLVLAFGLVLQGRPAYVASGIEVGRGGAGEPLLKNVTAKALPL